MTYVAVVFVFYMSELSLRYAAENMRAHETKQAPTICTPRALQAFLPVYLRGSHI